MAGLRRGRSPDRARPAAAARAAPGARRRQRERCGEKNAVSGRISLLRAVEQFPRPRQCRLVGRHEPREPDAGERLLPRRRRLERRQGPSAAPSASRRVRGRRRRTARPPAAARTWSPPAASTRTAASEAPRRTRGRAARRPCSPGSRGASPTARCSTRRCARRAADLPTGRARARGRTRRVAGDRHQLESREARRPRHRAGRRDQRPRLGGFAALLDRLQLRRQLERRAVLQPERQRQRAPGGVGRREPIDARLLGLEVDGRRSPGFQPAAAAIAAAKRVHGRLRFGRRARVARRAHDERHRAGLRGDVRRADGSPTIAARPSASGQPLDEETPANRTRLHP